MWNYSQPTIRILKSRHRDVSSGLGIAVQVITGADAWENPQADSRYCNCSSALKIAVQCGGRGVLLRIRKHGASSPYQDISWPCAAARLISASVIGSFSACRTRPRSRLQCNSKNVSRRVSKEIRREVSRRVFEIFTIPNAAHCRDGALTRRRNRFSGGYDEV
jgi:hypothetical protein